MLAKPLKSKKVPFSFRTLKRYLFPCFPSLSSARKIPFSFRTGKRYLFRCFKTYFFLCCPPLKPKKIPFFVPDRKKVPFFCVFQASQAQKKYLVFVPNNRKKGTFFQASQAQKRYLFRSGREKGTFFGVFQASQAQKRYLFVPDRKTYLFFGLFQASQKGTFFGVFQASQAQKKVLFCVPDRFWVFFKPLKPKKRYLFRSGPEKCTFYRTACEPNRSTGSNRFTRT